MTGIIKKKKKEFTDKIIIFFYGIIFKIVIIEAIAIYYIINI